jgi:hypothetical protein
MGNDNLPRITYNTSSGLKYVQCTNVSCSTKNTKIISTTGGYPSAITLGSDGYARIIYTESDRKTMKLARLTSDNGETVYSGSSLGNSIEKINHLYSQYVSTGVLSADTLNASNGLTVGTASSGLFSVLSNGNVGIGIDVPTTALNIRAESPTVLLQGTASTSQAGVRMVNDVNQAVYTWMSGSGSNWMSERAVMYAPALTFVADANQTGANGQSGAGNIWFLANDYRQLPVHLRWLLTVTAPLV